MLSTDLADLRAHMAQNPGAVIEDVARERKVSPRAVIEALPPEMVRIGRGYFNLMRPKGLHGHLRHERCDAIAFVERPFMGKSSAFIAFINIDGGIMFKVFVGRDEERALRQDQLARFHSLAERIGAK